MGLPSSVLVTHHGDDVKKRRTTITIEKEHVLVIGRRNRAVAVWCNGCGEQVTMISVEEAAAVAGVKTRAIYREVEAGKFHFTETPDGILRICLSSLMRYHPA